ncbi:Thionin-like protein 2, partial [Cucurbita argyrosperma subsp. sororia]
MGTGSSQHLGMPELSRNPSNGYCYALCGLACLSGPIECALCIGSCMISAQDSPMDINHLNNAYFCKLGCATSRCTRLLSNARTGITLGTCGATCLAKCLFIASAPMDFNHMDTHYFCKLGCATSMCTKFSTKNDPSEKKVERCVDSCAGNMHQSLESRNMKKEEKELGLALTPSINKHNLVHAWFHGFKFVHDI